MSGAVVRRALVACTLLACGACIDLDRLIYLAPKTDHYGLPGNEVPAGQLELRTLVAEDGVALGSALALQDEPATAPSVLYLHGQAENIDGAWPDAQRLWKAGFNVLVLDYRGFGTSAGEPSEAGLYRDARAGFAALAGDARLDPRRIAVYGFSMGTGVASELALEAPAALLVLEAPFTSMTDLVENSSPYAVPADWITSIRLDTLGRISEVPIPVLVIRGEDDRRIPAWMPEQVYRRARDPKRLLDVPGAGHGGVLSRAAGEVVEAMAGLVPALDPAATTVTRP